MCLNLVRNDLDRTLDLVLSDIDQSKVIIERCLNPLVNEDGHHPALVVDIDVEPFKYLRERKPAKPNFYRADYKELDRKLSSVEWLIELDGMDVNSAVNRFYEILE